MLPEPAQSPDQPTKWWSGRGVALHMAVWPWGTGLGVQLTIPPLTGAMLMPWVVNSNVALTYCGLVTLVSWHGPVPAPVF